MVKSGQDLQNIEKMRGFLTEIDKKSHQIDTYLKLT